MNTVSTLDRLRPDEPDEPTSTPPSGRPPSFWARLGGRAYDRRGRVLLAWVVVLVAVVGAVGTIGASTDSSFDTPDSESARGFDILQENFADAGSFLSGSIVFEAAQGFDDPAVQSAMEQLFAEIDALEDATVTSPYSPSGQQQGLVSSDGTIAFASVSISDGADEVRASEIGGEIATLAEEIDIDGLNIEIGGAALAEFEPPEAELIGLAFAIIILIVSFGSVLAMGLPIGVALFGVGIGVGTITLLTNVITIPDFATTLGAMIGLGVGIDYALFIVTRYREGTRAGFDKRTATVTAIDTAGRAVVFAGATVVISLLGMYVMGLSFINGLATGAAITVAITMVASITLLPALIGFAADRVEVTRWRGLVMAVGASLGLFGRGLGFPAIGVLGVIVLVGGLIASFFVPKLRQALPPRQEKALRDTWSYRWSRFVQRNPWPMAIGVTVLLLVMSIPVLDLRLGFGDESTFAETTTTRQAYDLLADGFGPGSNGALLLTAQIDDPSQIPALQSVVAQVAETPGVAQALGRSPRNRWTRSSSAWCP